MNIHLNGEVFEIESGHTIAQLIEQLGLQGKRIAVEHNLEILPKSEHGAVVLREDDRVEIVHAIGGG